MCDGHSDVCLLLQVWQQRSWWYLRLNPVVSAELENVEHANKYIVFELRPSVKAVLSKYYNSLGNPGGS
jgi:hypothetical protein